MKRIKLKKVIFCNLDEDSLFIIKFYTRNVYLAFDIDELNLDIDRKYILDIKVSEAPLLRILFDVTE
jgi:hypothetical protein